MSVAKRSNKTNTAVVFVAGVKSLGQDDQTWEADFRALPKTLRQSDTQYLGLVVSKNGLVLAQSQVDGRPKAIDLSALLAAAMQRPLVGKARRPSRLHVRGHRQWHELLPSLEELGIQVSIRQELSKAKVAFNRHLEQLQAAWRATMVKPSEKQAGVEKLFPAVAKWVQGWGHIEIGEQEGFGFTVRAIDYGGVVFEDDKAETLAEAMTALEHGLAEYFEQDGSE